MPIVILMNVPPPTPFWTIIGNWANQSFNALNNYGNRNASSTYTTKTIIISYFCAVGSSIAVGLGVRYALEPTTRSMTGGMLFLFNAFSSTLSS